MEEKELSNKELDAVSGGAEFGSGNREMYTVSHHTSIYRAPDDRDIMCIGSVRRGTRLKDVLPGGSGWKMFRIAPNPGIVLNSSGLDCKNAYIKTSDLRPH